SLTLRNGTLARSLLALGGTGTDRVTLGGSSPGETLTIKGDTNVGLGGAWDYLYVNAGVQLKGSLNTNSVNTVVVAAGSKVNGNVSLVGGGAGSQFTLGGRVGGSVQIEGSERADMVTVQSSAVIAGALLAHLR